MSKSFNLTPAIFSLLSVGYLVTVASSSQAAILNGGFENGLNNWTTIGDVSTQTSAFGSTPTEGASQALLTTAAPGETGFNFSANTPALVGFSKGLEDFLGLPLGSIDPDPENFVSATEGSAIKQTLTIKAGDVLSFDWNLLSNDSANPDYAFVALNGLSSLVGSTLLTLNSNTVFDKETGLRTFSYTFNTSGIYTLGIGVVDAIDVEVPSALLVDNVKIKSGLSTQVPEPGSVVGVLALGAFGAGSALLRKQKQHKSTEKQKAN